MNKKHWLGMLVVLAISAYVFYRDLRTVNTQALIKAAGDINIFFLVLVFGAMILSYVFEAGILATLVHRKNDPKHSAWSFLRIPVIQALFNGITPMSSGGQPSQLVAMIQMGIEGGRATSILLMKFIIFQIVVFFAYIFAIIFGFHMVVTKFAGLAFFIFIGFIIHITSIIFLLAILLVNNWTKRATNAIFNFLGKFIAKDKIEKWRKATLDKVDTFYAEGQKLKKEKKKLFISLILTVGQLLLFYSIPYLILLALNIHASWLQVTEMNIMEMMFMAIIPIPGATGGAEFSFQELFKTFIFVRVDLVLATFLWRFVTYFFGMILGLFGWMFKPKKIKSN